MPVNDLTTPGYQPPYTVQFSIFLDNRVGKLLELLEVFQGQALALVGLSVLETTDHAVVRIVTSNSQLARRLLQRHDMPYSESEVIVAELPEPDSFTRICTELLNAELSINYTYPLLCQPRGRPAVVIHVDDRVLATQILRRKLFTLLEENDLGDNAAGSDPLDPHPGQN
jgi:hypothetical protein